jgi:hypothetical protein
MTYRYVPQRWRLVAQLTTLLGTAAIGISLVLTPTPAEDPRTTEFEQAMGADAWGLMLIVFGVLGVICEGSGVIWHTRKLFWVVSMCHIVLFSLMLVYGAAALWGLIDRGQWWNFAAPVLAVMIAIWHYAYIMRRPKMPVERLP